jgi:hypothetical protein
VIEPSQCGMAFVLPQRLPGALFAPSTGADRRRQIEPQVSSRMQYHLPGYGGFMRSSQHVAGASLSSVSRQARSINDVTRPTNGIIVPNITLGGIDGGGGGGAISGDSGTASDAAVSPPPRESNGNALATSVGHSGYTGHLTRQREVVGCTVGQARRTALEEHAAVRATSPQHKLFFEHESFADSALRNRPAASAARSESAPRDGGAPRQQVQQPRPRVFVAPQRAAAQGIGSSSSSSSSSNNNISSSNYPEAGTIKREPISPDPSRFRSKGAGQPSSWRADPSRQVRQMAQSLAVHTHSDVRLNNAQFAARAGVQAAELFSPARLSHGHEDDGGNAASLPQRLPGYTGHIRGAQHMAGHTFYKATRTFDESAFATNTSAFAPPASVLPRHIQQRADMTAGGAPRRRVAGYSGHIPQEREWVGQ